MSAPAAAVHPPEPSESRPTILGVSTETNDAPAAVLARVDELRALIKGYDAQYYLEDASDIGDAEYDALKDELLTLEEQHPELIKADSPTQTGGAAAAADEGGLAAADRRDGALGAVRGCHPPHAHDEPRQGHHARGDPLLGGPVAGAVGYRARRALALP